jgi:phosphate/phosphite/phosphonate ABC transporter binding protein
MTMTTLTFTSCQAPVADDLCQQVAQYLSNRLNIPTTVVADIPWQTRERRFDAGQIDIAWICGVPYVWKADQPAAHVELLAAPVMAAARYQQQPVYFSDVVVHRASSFQHFADLRGATWAYNEPHSHSGYHVVRYALALLGESMGYFGRVVESGAHATSLHYILNRQVDAAAIDSTVLEMLCARQPEIRSQIRVVATLGPSPMPPWVIGLHVAPELRAQLRGLLLTMHADPQGQAILADSSLTRFAAVTDATYDTIRHMLQVGATAELGAAHAVEPGAPNTPRAAQSRARLPPGLSRKRTVVDR